MPNIATYNAKDCSIIVEDVHLTGLGEDMVSVSKQEAFFETSVGAQGDIVKSEVNNSLYDIEITVQVTSPQMPFLLELKNRTEPFQVWVINKKLGIRAGGTKANIAEMPEISLGATAEDVSITFTVFDGDIQPVTE